MDPIVTIVIVVVAAVLVGTIAFFMGIKYRKKVGEAQIGAAETKTCVPHLKASRLSPNRSSTTQSFEESGQD